MNEKKRVDQLELLLSELIHSNAIAEKRNDIAEKRLNAIEKLQYITIPVLALTGAGTLFAIVKLLTSF